MKDFIERLKSKPHHVRQHIALGTSVGITGVVAGVWLIALIFSGKLLLPSSTVGTSSGDASPTVAATDAQPSGVSSLLGAVGVATATTTQPALTIVDAPKPTPAPQPELNSEGQTVIPF